ncbi:MAG: type II secretion system protein N [Parvularculaceae bacterium]
MVIEDDTAPRRRGGGAKIIIALAAFVAGVGAFAPAELFAVAAARGSAFDYVGARGTIWRGAVIGASYDGILLGDIDFTLRPASLLRGRVRISASSSNGAMRGAGDISVGLRRLSISGLNGEFDLGAIRRYSFFGAPYRGRMRIDMTGLRLSRDGCDAGSGTLWTNALTVSAGQWNATGFDLSGPVMCENGELRAKLSGAGVEGRLEISGAVDSGLNFSMQAIAAPRRPEVYNALKLLQFEPKDDVLSYQAVGKLKGFTS